VAAVGRAAAEGAKTGAHPTGVNQGPSIATLLLWVGGAVLAAGLIYFLVTAGFPPHTTTTYEFRPDGSTTTSTSPSAAEFVISIGLIVIGSVLLRAGKVASQSGK
jgi:hypothetical protein